MAGHVTWKVPQVQTQLQRVRTDPLFRNTGNPDLSVETKADEDWIYKWSGPGPDAIMVGIRHKDSDAWLPATTRGMRPITRAQHEQDKRAEEDRKRRAEEEKKKKREPRPTRTYQGPGSASVSGRGGRPHREPSIRPWRPEPRPVPTQFGRLPFPPSSIRTDKRTGLGRPHRRAARPARPRPQHQLSNLERWEWNPFVCKRPARNQ